VFVLVYVLFCVDVLVFVLFLSCVFCFACLDVYVCVCVFWLVCVLVFIVLAWGGCVYTLKLGYCGVFAGMRVGGGVFMCRVCFLRYWSVYTLKLGYMQVITVCGRRGPSSGVYAGLSGFLRYWSVYTLKLGYRQIYAGRVLMRAVQRDANCLNVFFNMFIHVYAFNVLQKRKIYKEV